MYIIHCILEMIDNIDWLSAFDYNNVKLYTIYWCFVSLMNKFPVQFFGERELFLSKISFWFFDFINIFVTFFNSCEIKQIIYL